jgi:hypothetical protein
MPYYIKCLSGAWQLSIPRTNINCVQKLVYLLQISFSMHSMEQSFLVKLKLAYLLSFNWNWEFIFIFKTEHYWNPTRAKQIMFTPSHSISLKSQHYVRASKTITLERLQMFRGQARLLSWIRFIFFYETMINKIIVITSNLMKQSSLLTVMVKLWSSRVICLQWLYSCDTAESCAYSDGKIVIQQSHLLAVMVELWYSRVICLQWW